MSNFIKIGDIIINLANVTEIHLHFNGPDTVRVYFNTSNDGGTDWVQFHGDEAAALRRWFKNTIDIVDYARQMADIDAVMSKGER